MMRERASSEASPGESAHGPPSRHRSLRWLAGNPYLLLALASLFWSINHVLGRAIAGHVPPFAISTIRWFVPALLLWPFARPHLARDWPLIKRHPGVLLLLGVTGGAIFTALQYVGLQYTTAVNVSVLNSLAPVFIIGIGAALFGDRLAGVQLFGIVTSLCGVLVIIARADLTTLAQLQFNWGDIIIVVNMAVAAVYASCLRLRPQIHWLSFLFVLAVISTLGTAPFFLWEMFSGLTLQPTLLTFSALVYVSLFPSIAAYAAWNRGIELIGANRSGPFLHLIPLYSAVLATAFLGESLLIYHVLGFVLIIAGVWFASRKS